MIRALYFFLFSVFSLQMYATHNRAGEITYSWIGGLTYEAVITTYTKESVPADRCDLILDWGDNTSSTLHRENGSVGSCPSPAKMGQSLGGNIRYNVYRGQHTYQSPGFYTLAMQDINRVENISNIPSSVQVPFYITTVLNVNPALGVNSSPTLLNPPIDDGCQNEVFIHNPGAWDPDGDSLAYSLVNCRGLGGVQIVETYSPTLVQDPVTIDQTTGDFVWDVPKSQGLYNFAIQITEYRKGPNGVWQIVGQVTRDMQIDIKSCNNQPPIITPLGPFCVEVDENLQFTVQATDPNNNPISLTATGGPLLVNPKAQFAQPTNGVGNVQQVFSWTPGCAHVQKQPWYMYFKVEDSPSPASGSPPLVDYMTVEITVIAPAPKNPQAVPNNKKAINVSWNQTICPNALGYYIYRRDGFYGYVPDSCETGVPAYTGYTFLDEVIGVQDTSYLDSINLKNGTRYCYMITAFFADGAESRASEEACTELKKTAPMLTNVDVLTTDISTGSIAVKWIAPKDIDSLSFPPPYSYGLERANGIEGSNFVEIATFTSLQDTFYTDNNLNTKDQGYSYRVAFYSGQNKVLVAYSDAASSVYLTIFPFDLENRLRFNFSVPWQNERFTVYKEQSFGSGIFDSIAIVNTNTFIDTGLINGQTYCYKVKSIGRYTGNGLPEPLINNSQIACATPLDTTAPCAPILKAEIDCEGGVLDLSWTDASGEFCSKDIRFFNIYYKATEDAPWPSIPFVANVDASQMQYSIIKPSIVGCYVVTAADDAIPANESKYSNIICIDGCPLIELPNVFSPNGNPPNNYFRPVRDVNGNPRFKDIDTFTLQVFNRWGSLVFETTDANQFVEYGWDGKDRSTGQDVADGVYFYVFTYQTRSVVAQPQQVLNGTVTLFR